MGIIAPRAANQTMTSYFGFMMFVDCLILGSKEKSRTTSAFAPMEFKSLNVKAGFVARPARVHGPFGADGENCDVGKHNGKGR